MIGWIPPLLLWFFAVSNRQQHTNSGASCQESHAILIDVENLRGKAGFRLTHAQILTSVAHWSRACHLSGRCVLVVDHGQEPTALWVQDMAVVFSGRAKADHVLATDLVPYLVDLPQVTLVTADRELIQRCRRASGVTQRLHVLSPALLLRDLQGILEDASLSLSPLVSSWGNIMTRADEEDDDIHPHEDGRYSNVPTTQRKHLMARTGPSSHMAAALCRRLVVVVVILHY